MSTPYTNLCEDSAIPIHLKLQEAKYCIKRNELNNNISYFLEHLNILKYNTQPGIGYIHVAL